VCVCGCVGVLHLPLATPQVQYYEFLSLLISLAWLNFL